MFNLFKKPILDKKVCIQMLSEVYSQHEAEHLYGYIKKGIKYGFMCSGFNTSCEEGTSIGELIKNNPEKAYEIIEDHVLMKKDPKLLAKKYKEKEKQKQNQKVD